YGGTSVGPPRRSRCARGRRHRMRVLSRGHPPRRLAPAPRCRTSWLPPHSSLPSLLSDPSRRKAVFRSPVEARRILAASPRNRPGFDGDSIPREDGAHASSALLISLRRAKQWTPAQGRSVGHSGWLPAQIIETAESASLAAYVPLVCVPGH